MSARLALVLLGAAAASCGGERCPTPRAPPAPMTEARAHQLEPGVVTGLALSTTYVHGDCRPTASASEGSGASACGSAMACVRERAALRVFVVAVNRSVPVSPACEGGYAVEELAPLSVLDARASEDGELVVALARGTYRVYVSRDERCATCGIADGAPSGCLVEVPHERLAVRDLVLDAATH